MIKWRMIESLGAALLLAVAACGGVPASTSATASSEGATRSASELDIVPLTIVSGGRTHNFRVEVARTPEQQSRGMMFRDRLTPDRGMIFPYASPQPLRFWMKNTPNSLDLIFIGADRRIESIAPDAVPFSEEGISSVGPVVGVLEIAGGRAAELGLQAGDRVEWRG